MDDGTTGFGPVIEARQRIDPLTLADMSPAALELLSESTINDGGVLRRRTDKDPVHPFQATLLRAPTLLKKFGGFAGQLLIRGTLPEREREMVCLRTGWLCQGALEFGEHVEIAHAAGLTPDDVNRIVSGPSEPTWETEERALLLAVDELHGDGHISDETWAELAVTHDEQQLIELPFLIGAYHTVAFVQNALQIALPEGNAGLAAR